MAYGSTTSSSTSSSTTATDYSSVGYDTLTSTNTSNVGISEAKSLRENLGKVQDYFDNRLTTGTINFNFSFDPQTYDVIYGNLTSAGVSTVSAEILSYEVIALSKMYDVGYTDILPIVKNSKIVITKDQIKKLNETRPSTNNLNIINTNVSNDILKEQVD
tara:strand:- start:62 stop:541 length:480 start_codon:yes stop_codon:yes gene_type:complete